MKKTVRIALNASPEQVARMIALQTAFAEACNALAPVVVQTRCWNRVALHHLAYKQLRQQFPHIGSQMVCNAIYSVSRTCRVIYQHPGSPFNLTALGDQPLPMIRFADTCPVYFDRHTLSIKDGKLSMYTLDGRMHFELALNAETEASFHEKKLHEVVLSRDRADVFGLTFVFSDEPGEDAPVPMAAVMSGIPDYVQIDHHP